MVAPRRPVYEEPARLNRRIYYGAVRGVTRVADSIVAIPRACVELLGVLLELSASWVPWLVFALIVYVLAHCSANEPSQGAAAPVRQPDSAYTNSGTGRPLKHRHPHRTQHHQLTPESTGSSPAGSAS